jgi:hypothetical protein
MQSVLMLRGAEGMPSAKDLAAKNEQDLGDYVSALAMLQEAELAKTAA